MTDLLWHEASAPADAARSSERMMRAKVAVAGVWPFLALARSATEFNHRLALVDDHLAERVPADLLDAVTASLRSDFAKTAAPYDLDNWGDRHREMNPMTYDPGMDHVGPGPHGDDDDAVSHAEKATRLYPGQNDGPGRVNGADIDAIQKHLPEGSPYKRAAQTWDGKPTTVTPTTRRKLDPNDPTDAMLLRQRRNSTGEAPDDEGDRYWDQTHKSSRTAAWWDEHDERGATEDMPEGQVGSLWDDPEFHADHDTDERQRPGAGEKVHHPAGWTAHHDAGGSIAIGHEATPNATYDMVDPTSHANVRDALHSWVDSGHGRWAEHNVPSVREHINNLKTSARTPVQFWHEGAQKWVTAAVDSGPQGQGGNPYYFDGGPELGPDTHNTGQYPQHPTGSDPIDPLNQQFPMQPSPWSNAGGWETHDMHLMPGARNYAQGARLANLSWEQGYGGNDHVGYNPSNGIVHAVVQSQPDGSARMKYHPYGDDSDRDSRISYHGSTSEAMEAGDRRHNSFTPRGAARYAADGWSDEGVQTGLGPNPYFFSGGDEGVQGGQPAQFPTDPPITGNPDVNVAPEQTSEPLENRVEMYDHLDSWPTYDDGSGLGETTGRRRPFVWTAEGHTRPRQVTDDNPHVNDFGQVSDKASEHNRYTPVHPKERKEKGPPEDKGEEAKKHRASNGFFDPTDASVRVVGIASPDGSGGPGFGGTNPSDGIAHNLGTMFDGVSGATPGGGNKAVDPSSLQMDMGGGANTPQDGGGADSMAGMGGSGQKASALRFVWAADAPPGAPDGGGGGAPPPPSMSIGGPGAEAMPPMPGGAGVPQTTSPAQTPGGGPGGGMDAGATPAPGQAPAPPTSANAPQGGAPKAASMVALAAELNRGIPTLDNPTGAPGADEFMNKTFDNALETRPRQSADHRNVNTPQNPGAIEPIRTTPSAGAPQQQQPDQGEED